MSLQKVLYTIKGAAHEQRALADQCIHAPKLKASSLQNADDMDAAAKYVEEMSELLRSACAIADRRGADTAWERFKASAANLGLNGITARTYRLLPDDPRDL